MPKRIWITPYHWAKTLLRLRRRCALCQRAHTSSLLICAQCFSQISVKVPPVKIMLSHQSWLPLFAVSYYQFPVNSLISRYKDHEDIEALMVLIGLLQTLPKPKNCHATNTIIIPVPTTDSRLQKRGFNPVLTLAKHLAKQWQLPIWMGVRRYDGKQHQRGLDRQARLQNTQTDFYLVGKLPVLQVILFDDVATTGATLAAIAGVIKDRYPMAKILAVCMAHGTAEFGLQKLS